MRVVHLCTTDFWDQGILAYRIHKGVEQLGVESTFITIMKSSGDPSVKMMVLDPVYKNKVKLKEKTRLNTPAIIGDIFGGWRNRLNIPILVREGDVEFSLTDSPFDLLSISEVQHADIIHLHWAPGMIDFEMAPLFFMGKPVVISMCDTSYITGGCHFLNGCDGFKKGCKNCPRLDTKDAKEIVSNAYNIKMDAYKLMDIYPVAKCLNIKHLAGEVFDRVEFIHPCTPFGSFKAISQKKARDILGIEGDKFVVMDVVSSLGNKKNKILELIDMLNSMYLDGFKDLYGILIGGDYTEIKEEIKVDFPLLILPLIPSEEVMHWYFSAADVFISTNFSYIDLFAIDALATGVPVIGFKNSFVGDIVEHKVTGYVVDNEDFTSLKQGIKHFTQIDRNLTKRKCRHAAKKKFSLEDNSKKYYEFYKDILSSKRDVKFDKMLRWGEKLYRENKKYYALKLFEKLLECNKESGELLNNIGVIYWENKRFKEAREYFKRAYELAPDNEDIRENYYNARNL